MLIKTSGGKKYADFSYKIAEYLKEKLNLNIDFMSGDHEDWEYYFKKGFTNTRDVKDYFNKISLKYISLDMYKRWNLDKNKMLLTNYVRFKRYGSKTIEHPAIQEKYLLLQELVHKFYVLKVNYQFDRIYNKMLFLILKITLYPFKLFAFRKTYNIIRPIHLILYLLSRWILILFNPFFKTIKSIKWRKKIENLQEIALVNSKRNFSIISKIALQYFISYYLILKELKPDLVFMYNDNWIANTSMTMACEKLDIPHYYTEQSNILEYSHFDSTAIWFEGDINRKQLPEWDNQKETKLNNRIKEYLKKYKLGVASIIGEEKKVKKMIHDKKFIFVPMQVMDDTKNIKYSPLIENMVQLVNLIIEHTPEGYDIIIKRHPWEYYKKDPLYYKSLNEIMKIAKRNKHVNVCRRVDPYFLLKQCSAFVTINSTMSQENLYEARAPMIILGDTYIRGWGFSYDVNNIDEFPVKLKEALEKGVNPEMELKIKQFLYLFFFNHVVRGHYALSFPVRNDKGEVIKKWEKSAVYEYIAEKIYTALIEIKERKSKGLKRMLPPPKTLRCMIDRSKLPNYKGVILDAKYKPYPLKTHV